MAIVGPADLPVVLKVQSDPIKKWVMSKLGHPSVSVELTEDQLETIIRTMGDWISGYFPREQRLAVFHTSPLRSTYPMPSDAYWIQEVSWDPATTNVTNIFSAESYLFNVGNITGINQMLTDYHLLQAYRKFSQKILSTEGHWEVTNETADGDTTQQLIRLYPTPKGVYPVVVLYLPVITQFRSPQSRKLLLDAVTAEAKVTLGHIRRKISNMPSPTGGSITYDGDALVQEGTKELDELAKKAIDLGEPLRVHMWSLWPLLLTLAGSLATMVV